MGQLDLLGGMLLDGYQVAPVSYEITKPFILNIHYAGRMPPIKQAFGLYLDNDLCGIVTFGVPPSHTLLKGVCGIEYKGMVLELNRLVLLHNRPNEASRLVGGAMRLLGDRIIVSYADSVRDHTGFVYQATNFLYTGKTKAVKEIYLKSAPHLHHTTHRGKTYAMMADEYGDDVAFRYRSIKHRYVTFVGSKSFRKAARKALNYKVTEYPKAGANQKEVTCG